MATLIHGARTLQRPLLKVSTLFLDIKAGFDNVSAARLRAILLSNKIPSYMVDWVSSFLPGRKCTLVFQGAPNIPAAVSVGTPQGSHLSPLLFLIYVASLHFRIPTGIMVLYVNDFSLTVASQSRRSYIRRLKALFREFPERPQSSRYPSLYQKLNLSTGAAPVRGPISPALRLPWTAKSSTRPGW